MRNILITNRPKEQNNWENIGKQVFIYLTNNQLANLILKRNTKVMRQALKNINQKFYKELTNVKEWADKNRVNAKWDKVLNGTFSLSPNK